jgi:hypothetical protein
MSAASGLAREAQDEKGPDMTPPITRPEGSRALLFVLTAAAVMAVACGGSGKTRAGSGGGHRSVATAGVLLTYGAEPTLQAPGIDSTVMQQAASVVRGRLDAVAPGAQVSARGHQLIVRVGVQMRTVGTQTFPSVVEVVSLASAPARLLLYDWEANALAPSGKPVASVLLTRDPSALAISQGAGSQAPGLPGAGSMPLYQAVKLAAKQPELVSGKNARVGPEYFAFGAPGSSACARAYHGSQIVGQHCYLAGPQDNLSDLQAAMPTGVSTSSNGVQTLAVPQGWVVLQAVPSAGFDQELAWSNPSAQYYVLRDRAALSGNEITNPRQSTDQEGQPDVTFGFTTEGAQIY